MLASMHESAFELMYQHEFSSSRYVVSHTTDSRMAQGSDKGTSKIQGAPTCGVC